jgi:uncharacterized coiled-coil DUF342 family protein
MDFQRLEVLEEKIKKLVTALKALQAENDLLNRKKEEHEKTIVKLKQDLEKWSKSVEESNALQEQLDGLQNEREEVKGRVERLISNLEELEAKLV